MTRRELVDSMLARYGISVWIKPENSEQTVDCRAFLQPLQFKAKPVSNEIGMPAGNPDKSYWLYIGSASQRLDQQFGTVIRTAGQSYLFAARNCTQLCLWLGFLRGYYLL